MTVCSRFFSQFISLTIFSFAFMFSQASSEEITLKQDGIDFILQYMPASDKDKIPLSRIEQEVDKALSVRSRFPWASQVPWSIYRNDVLPYAVIDENRDSWREDMERITAPLVKDCETARDAVLVIAANIGKASGVKYSIERQKPNQSAKESMASGLASCTGQSILLVNSLRSVGIPARLAGVLLWSHVMGNHTWVEAWCDGKWEMIEWNEKDFNTPWVMENIGMLDTSRQEHRIIATSWEEGNTIYPLIWNFKREEGHLTSPAGDKLVPGVDVTDRYIQLAKKWYKSNGTNDDRQKLYVDCVQLVGEGKSLRKPVEVRLMDENGSELEKGMTPSPEKDVRQFLKFFIPQGKTCSLEWNTPDGMVQKKKVVVSNNAPVQIVNLEYPNE